MRPARQRARLQRKRRVLVPFLAGLLGTVIPFILAMAFFLQPPTKELEPSDAVVVLGGAADGRHVRGAELVNEGLADNFVVAVPRGPSDRVGWSYCTGEHTPGATTWCLRPEPSTTAGEAMGVEKLAEQNGWTSVTVVTSRPHTRRTQMIFDRCTDLDVTVTHIDHVRWWLVPRDMARETLGALKFWVQDPCEA